MGKSATNQWTEAEDEVLRAHYLERGPRWQGWADLLPDRTPRAIQSRAQRLRLASRGNTPDDASRHEADVASMMESGMTVTQIDEALGLPHGAARSIAAEMWRRDKEGRR